MGCTIRMIGPTGTLTLPTKDQTHTHTRAEAPQKGLRPRQTIIRLGKSKSSLTIFVETIFSLVSRKRRLKIDFTKIVKSDMDSLSQELFNSGLGIVVAPTVFSGIIFLSARIGCPIQL